LLINKPKFAILLAACNGEAWIEDQLVSILNQSHISLDIFICIDWSKDSTFLIVKKLKNEYKNIYLLSYRNKFGSAAKNFFNLIKRINLKKYDFIAFSDQDDIWLPNKLYRAYQILNKNKDSWENIIKLN
jgi:rhamnosyltransferase